MSINKFTTSNFNMVECYHNFTLLKFDRVTEILIFYFVIF